MSYGQIYRVFRYNEKAVFVYSPEQLGYKFSDTHPFNHKRLTLTMDLLKILMHSMM